jgi:hypothetical protein
MLLLLLLDRLLKPMSLLLLLLLLLLNRLLKPMSLLLLLLLLLLLNRLLKPMSLLLLLLDRLLEPMPPLLLLLPLRAASALTEQVGQAHFVLPQLRQLSKDLARHHVTAALVVRKRYGLLEPAAPNQQWAEVLGWLLQIQQCRCPGRSCRGG